MIPVQAILPRALAEIIRKAPLTQDKVAFAWRTAVGPVVAGATEIVLEGTTLRVRTRDRAWQRELEHSAALIRTRLDDLLGAGVVRYIDVTSAPASAVFRSRPAATRRATVPAAAAPAPRKPTSAGGSGSVRRRR